MTWGNITENVWVINAWINISWKTWANTLLNNALNRWNPTPVKSPVLVLLYTTKSKYKINSLTKYCSFNVMLIHTVNIISYNILKAVLNNERHIWPNTIVKTKNK